MFLQLNLMISLTKKNMLNLDQLLETCIIPTDNKQNNFEYVPIYYFNSSYRFIYETAQLINWAVFTRLLIIIFRYIEDPQELIRTRIRNDSKTTYIIESIELINNRYRIRCSDI